MGKKEKPEYRKRKKNDVIPFESYLSFNIKDIWIGLRQEPWSFWFLCLYLLLEYSRVQSIYHWPEFIPWLQTSLLAAIIAVTVGREPKWVSSACTLPLVLFLLHAWFTSNFAMDKAVSQEYFTQLINWLIIYYLILVICTTRKRLYIVFLLLIIVSFKMANHGFMSFAGRGFAFSRWGLAGPPGWFGNAADLAIQLLIYICLVAGFIYITRDYTSKWMKALLVWMIIAGFGSIIGTGNRGTIVALVPMFMYVLLFFKNRARNLVLLTVISGLLFYFSPDEFKQRFETAGEDRTSESRLQLWERGYETGIKYPFVGVGYHNWQVYNYRYFNEYNHLVIHNSPITVFAELGFPGIFLYLLLHLTVLITNIKTRRIGLKNGDEFAAIMSVSLNIGLMGFAAASLFVTVCYYPFLYIQLALTAALHSITKKRANSINDKELATT